MSISEIFKGISATPGVAPSSPESRVSKPDGRLNGPSEFEALLKTRDLQLSQHAETRIRSRSIPWDAGLEKRISGGMDAAEAKGSREALILADKVAVIANIPSRTVVTAMNRDQMKDRIFTNIDSAVLV